MQNTPHAAVVHTLTYVKIISLWKWQFPQ